MQEKVHLNFKFFILNPAQGTWKEWGLFKNSYEVLDLES